MFGLEENLTACNRYLFIYFWLEGKVPLIGDDVLLALASCYYTPFLSTPTSLLFSFYLSIIPSISIFHVHIKKNKTRK